MPFRNSKLTRMLQPSLSGNARISVICTINPEVSAIAESTSTLQFAQRIKKVQVRRTYPGYSRLVTHRAGSIFPAERDEEGDR